MLFNSLTYLIFFPAICILYWCIPSKYRNVMLLIASYYFYMSWEPTYAILIIRHLIYGKTKTIIY